MYIKSFTYCSVSYETKVTTGIAQHIQLENCTDLIWKFNKQIKTNTKNNPAKISSFDLFMNIKKKKEKVYFLAARRK